MNVKTLGRAKPQPVASFDDQLDEVRRRWTAALASLRDAEERLAAFDAEKERTLAGLAADEAMGELTAGELEEARAQLDTEERARIRHVQLLGARVRGLNERALALIAAERARIDREEQQKAGQAGELEREADALEAQAAARREDAAALRVRNDADRDRNDGLRAEFDPGFRKSRMQSRRQHREYVTSLAKTLTRRQVDELQEPLRSDVRAVIDQRRRNVENERRALEARARAEWLEVGVTDPPRG